MSSKIETLRAILADDTVSAEQRQEAARVLAELEKKPEDAMTKISRFLAKIPEDYKRHVEHENSNFRVCGSCYRRQGINAEACELCGEVGDWQPAIIEGCRSERCRLIAAATSYTNEELNQRIRNSSDVAFTSHCARVLELRGVPRVKSYWELAGFTFTGKPLERPILEKHDYIPEVTSPLVPTSLALTSHLR